MNPLFTAVPRNRPVVWLQRSRVRTIHSVLIATSRYFQRGGEPTYRHSMIIISQNPTILDFCCLSVVSLQSNPVDEKYHEDYLVDENGFRCQAQG